MATSLTSPALVFAADKAIIACRKALAKAQLFCTDFSAEATQPGSTLKIPVFTPGAATDFNASTNNYESTDGSVSFASIAFDHHVKNTFQFDDKDFTLVNGSAFWANAGRASGDAIAQAISKALAGLIVKDAVSNEAVFAQSSKSALSALRKVCAEKGIDPAQTVVMLAPEAFAAILAALDANVYGGSEAIRQGIVEGLYGFKAVIEQSDLSTTATEKLVGALVPDTALAVAGRVVPVLSPGVYEEIGITTDEVSGLALGLRRHGNPATGANYATAEALFGAALVQPSKIVRLVSAATA